MAQSSTCAVPVVTFDIKDQENWINSEIIPSTNFFMKHFHLLVDVTIFFTIEGHFALAYKVTRLENKETICGEASFNSITNLRNEVRLHLFQLLTELSFGTDYCSNCDLPHRHQSCPKVPHVPNGVTCHRTFYQPPVSPVDKKKDAWKK